MYRLVVPLILLVFIGCRHPAPHAPRLTPESPTQPHSHTATQHFSTLPLKMARAELRAKVIESQRKRVAGRLRSLRDVERIVTEDAPIVEEAARQPEVRNALRQ